MYGRALKARHIDAEYAIKSELEMLQTCLPELMPDAVNSVCSGVEILPRLRAIDRAFSARNLQLADIWGFAPGWYRSRRWRLDRCLHRIKSCESIYLKQACANNSSAVTNLPILQWRKRDDMAIELHPETILSANPLVSPNFLSEFIRHPRKKRGILALRAYDDPAFDEDQELAARVEGRVGVRVGILPHHARVNVRNWELGTLWFDGMIYSPISGCY
jgi:hypothetical protein